jgi:excinuclease UvrABC nuclease subunit
MKERFIELMQEQKLMPINEHNWNYFEIDHQDTPCNDLRKIKQYITNHTQNKNGLYAYKDQYDNLLYVGKGKPIKERLYSHYIETYKQVSGDRSGKWHRFFNKHHGTIKLYWIELEDEGVRKFVEHVLTDEYNPEFLIFEKND